MVNVNTPRGFNLSFFDVKKARLNIKPNGNYVVGYARLSSDEDGSRFASIENQRSILEQTYKDKFKGRGSSFTFVYDDGFSGYTFDRPGILQIATLIEQGRCNVILAKDLSRIGRHGALVQYFIEQCESVGVHIHATDDYDSGKESDDLLLGIKTWSNERYVKEASAKIRKVLKHKQETGALLINVPFGYYIANRKTQRIEMNEKAAAIIRRIFRLYIDGMGIRSIANLLNDEGCPTASMMEEERAIAEGEPFRRPVTKLWSATYIMMILRNDFYIGILSTGVTTGTSIRGARERVPREEWHKFPNHHTAIIDEDTFNMAQMIYANRKRVKHRSKKYGEALFAGIVKCGECGRYESAARNILKDGTMSVTYKCLNYVVYGKNTCSPHNVSEALLVDVTVAILKQIVRLCSQYMEEIDKTMRTTKGYRPQVSELEQAQKELASVKARLIATETQRLKQIMAHPDREEEYSRLYDSMVAEMIGQQKRLEERIASLMDEEAKGTTAVMRAKTTVEKFEAIIATKKLTHAQLLTLYKDITIYEDGRILIELKPRFPDAIEQSLTNYQLKKVGRKLVLEEVAKNDEVNTPTPRVNLIANSNHLQFWYTCTKFYVA